MDKLQYNRPAKKWREALPLGNGMMGLMIYGSLEKECICFNDGTLWSGFPKDYNSRKSLDNLERVRELIFEGQNAKADRLCEKNLKGDYSEAFMPLGEVEITFNGLSHEGYLRSLDLSNAIHTVKSNGCIAEAFSSYPDKVSVYKIRSDTAFSAVVTAKSKLRHSTASEGNCLFLLGNAPDHASPNYRRSDLYPVRYNKKKSMAFCLQTQAASDGDVTVTDKCINVNNATELTLYFVTATGFNGFNKMPETDRMKVKEKCRTADAKIEKDYEKLKKRHIEDYSALYNSQQVSFDCDSDAMTDELLKSTKNGGDEKALSELLYNYGRYMIISGSRIGGQPLNLQGIWNESVRPPWSSNYTVNINTQMNYWGASRSGLSECIEPLIRMVYEALENGRKTARINYGCRGFACNHNVDLWRKTPPVRGSANYMFAPLCGVWLSNEIYFHYKNGFLAQYKKEIEEIVSEAARFCCDFLVLHEGKYVVCPSPSPENNFEKNGRHCKLDYASAFDMGLVRQSFKNAEELSDDEDLTSEIKEKTSLLYPFKKGENGICEWHRSFNTPEKGHRHFSPLYAFYPGNIIGYHGDPDMTSQIEKLFRYRLSNSGQHIGWSAAWAICLSARLRDAETVKSVIRGMLAHSVFSNLFCVHPPFYFQIDGNLGFVAGINEMLLTEEDGKIELLPALPKNFGESGEVKDMVVNGAKISFKWKKGVVTELYSTKTISVFGKRLDESISLGDNITVI